MGQRCRQLDSDIVIRGTLKYFEGANVKLYPLIALTCFGAALFGQEPATPAPEIPFDSVPNVLKLPANLYLGEASGVALDSKKHIFVFSRGNSTGPAYGATAAQILEFGPDGKYIREIGHNLYAWSFAHDVRVDKDDNLWAIDKGSGHDHQVQSRRPRHDGVSAARRKHRTKAPSRGSIPIRRCPPSTASSASPPTSPGIRRATSSSATATSTRASPSTTRTATG